MRLLRDRVRDSPPNPPNRVCDEADAPCLVKFLCGTNEPEIALVDQIAEQHSPMAIALCDRDDEAEICANEGIAGLEISGTNASRERSFFLATQ